MDINQILDPYRKTTLAMVCAMLSNNEAAVVNAVNGRASIRTQSNHYWQEKPLSSLLDISAILKQIDAQDDLSKDVRVGEQVYRAFDPSRYSTESFVNYYGFTKDEADELSLSERILYDSYILTAATALTKQLDRLAMSVMNSAATIQDPAEQALKEQENEGVMLELQQVKRGCKEEVGLMVKNISQFIKAYPMFDFIIKLNFGEKSQRGELIDKMRFIISANDAIKNKIASVIMLAEKHMATKRFSIEGKNFKGMLKDAINNLHGVPANSTSSIMSRLSSASPASWVSASPSSSNRAAASSSWVKGVPVRENIASSDNAQAVPASRSEADSLPKTRPRR